MKKYIVQVQENESHILFAFAWKKLAKNRFKEVENIPKNEAFLKVFKRASLKSGIPEMCYHISRNPEMGQLNLGIPEMRCHISGIREMG